MTAGLQRSGRRRWPIALAVLAVIGCQAAEAGAQATSTDSLTRKVTDSLPRPRPVANPFARPKPPISARRAFFTSFAVPGLAQTRLDRPTAGAFFSLIEFGAFAMTRRSLIDLQEARRFQQRTVRLSYTIDPVTGQPLRPAPADTAQRGLARELVRARRVHYEDWLAALIFNHLFAGADAFVGAQLWDVDATVSVLPMPRGAALVASLRW
jgi:hypothetical protein